MDATEMKGKTNGARKRVYRETSLLVVVPITSLHPGAGRGTAGSVADLPVQRDFLGIPCVWSSSLKGAMRSMFRDINSSSDVEDHNEKGNEIDLLFGPENVASEPYAGCTAFTDLKLLFMPGQCKYGLCLYTSISLIEFFASLLNTVFGLGIRNKSIKDIVIDTNEFIKFIRDENIYDDLNYKAMVASDKLMYGDKLVLPGNIVLGSDNILSLEGTKGKVLLSNIIRKLYKDILPGPVIEYIADNVIIVPRVLEKKIFGYTLLQLVTRIRLNKETKTVEEGALWTEENVPELSLFYGAILFSRPRRKKSKNKSGKEEGTKEESRDDYESCKELFMKILSKVAVSKEDSNSSGRLVFPLIIGGHETIGRGLVKAKIMY